MKGSLKKLTVFVTIAAITIFVVAGTASAGDRPGKTIHGVYGWTGPGNCMPTNENGAPVETATGRSFITAKGKITFTQDGTGKVQFTGVASSNLGAVLYEASYDHEYYIEPEGAITIDSVPNTYVQTFLTGPVGLQLFIDFLSLKGWISADHKTITIATPEPSVNKNCYVSRDCGNPEYSICNFSFTLVRIGGHEKDAE